MSEKLGKLITEIIGKVGEKQLFRILTELDENIPCLNNPDERIEYIENVGVYHSDEIDGG